MLGTPWLSAPGAVRVLPVCTSTKWLSAVPGLLMPQLCALYGLAFPVVVLLCPCPRTSQVTVAQTPAFIHQAVSSALHVFRASIDDRVECEWVKRHSITCHELSPVLLK